MKEIKAIAPNGLTVVSTFSGCGGSCLGYRMEGFRVVWANEFIPAARDTYRANWPDALIDPRDIRLVTGDDIRTATKLDEIDVLEGSPPCASFSTSSRREKHWGEVKQYSDTRQRTDDLFFEFARIVKELQPKVFVAENVSGLVKGTAKGYFKEILRTLKEGYYVKAAVLDAQWLGVPQARQRLIFIGVRNDLERQPSFPKPLPYRYSVREVLPWITRVKHGGSPNNWQSSKRPCPTITSAGGSLSPTASFSGGDFVEAETDMSGGNTAASVTPPTERRRFSIAELKRICGFPDDFILTGTFVQQWERLGRAVPPVMASHIAKTVRGILCRAA